MFVQIYVQKFTLTRGKCKRGGLVSIIAKNVRNFNFLPKCFVEGPSRILIIPDAPVISYD